MARKYYLSLYGVDSQATDADRAAIVPGEWERFDLAWSMLAKVEERFHLIGDGPVIDPADFPDGTTTYGSEVDLAEVAPNGDPLLSALRNRLDEHRRAEQSSRSASRPRLAAPPPPSSATRPDAEPRLNMAGPASAGLPPIDYDAMADRIGRTTGRFLRFMKNRARATHQEIEDKVFDGSPREWNSIKSLVVRTNNAIVEDMRNNEWCGPRVRFKTKQGSYLVIKQVWLMGPNGCLGASPRELSGIHP